MDIVPLIIQLVSGAVGGNVVGMLAKEIDQGTLINSIAGIVGGGIGGQILSAILSGGGAAVDPGMAAAAGGLDIGSIISSIAGGGVGGGILLAIVGAIRKAMAA